MLFVYVAVAVSVVCGFVGAYVAAVKGRPIVEGFIIGALLAQFGVVVEALLPNAGSTDPDDDVDAPEESDRVASKWLRELPK